MIGPVLQMFGGELEGGGLALLRQRCDCRKGP